MISRVTHQTMMRTAQANLQTNASQLAKLQDQASSRTKLTRPSDDPTAAADSLRVRAQQRAADQYQRNISDGTGWLATVDSALSASTDLMHRARDLTVRGANDGSLSPAAKEAIAVELESIRANLLSQANTSYQGRSVFAGNSDAGAAFVPDAVDPALLVHTGAGAGTVERRISEDATIRVDEDGAAVFGDGPDSVFALLGQIANDLRTGTNVGGRLAEIDVRMKAIIGQHAIVGSRHAQIMRAEGTNMDRIGALEARRSGVEDVDLGQVILDLKLQEINYQAALAVTARALPPTLMDFLR